MDINCAFISNSPEDTFEFGKEFSSYLKSGDVLILTGDLGAGKTNFVQGVGAGLGVNAQITSPTFNIEAIYSGRDMELYHFDLYRINDADELGDTGILDVAGVDGVCMVEWGAPFAENISPERLEITIERDVVEEDGLEPARIFHFKPVGASLKERFEVCSLL